jgi:hypothetical protein
MELLCFEVVIKPSVGKTSIFQKPFRGKFRNVACHGCSDFPKMAVFPFHDQNVAAMATFFDFDNPRSWATATAALNNQGPCGDFTYKQQRMGND